METSAPSPGTNDSTLPRRGNPWTLPLVLASGLAVASWLLVSVRPGANAWQTGADRPHVEWTPRTAAGETVALEIDFGNGARREYAALPYRDGMTVGDALRLARDFGPGLAFASQGEGKMSFLTSLDGVANQGPGGRCWLYEIDGKPGDVSYEVQPLVAGQRVLWRFAEPE
ncbi:hypothetical protein I41_00310 [Lacipirellula limnantheis]|uniref:Transcobalamin-like C-terminal domain-containing protein n=1 Tax=Lacipirellula limnantheis TaxID=2528024 RepID=A0A517TR91_9BACT|nr:hypothetical protein I41_00310 [Lacipirellula limnantheis]